MTYLCPHTMTLSGPVCSTSQSYTALASVTTPVSLGGTALLSAYPR